MSSNPVLVEQAVRSLPGEGPALSIFGRVRLSSAQTGGRLEVFQFDVQMGPPPHLHHDHDECFYILEGVYTFTLGQEQVEAPAGSLVNVPRGTRHGFKPGPGARALVFIYPAGIEGFFRELGDGFAAGRTEPEIRAALKDKYDSEPA